MASSDTRSGSGRPPEPDSLRSRIERGEARALQVVLDDELYRGLKVRSALTDRTLSDLVAEAVREWLERR